MWAGILSSLRLIRFVGCSTVKFFGPDAKEIEAGVVSNHEFGIIHAQVCFVDAVVDESYFSVLVRADGIEFFFAELVVFGDCERKVIKAQVGKWVLADFNKVFIECLVGLGVKAIVEFFGAACAGLCDEFERERDFGSIKTCFFDAMVSFFCERAKAVLLCVGEIMKSGHGTGGNATLCLKTF